MGIKGAILGDIAGSFLEEGRRFIIAELGSQIDWNRYPLFEDGCMFTDDTVMTLAIKKAIIENISFQESMHELGNHYPDCGWGHKFRDWLKSDNPIPYNSYGNGAAMRVSFIGTHFSDLDTVQKVAKESAEVTHDHPEGIKSAIVTATCVWMAKNKASKDEIFDYVAREYKDYVINPCMSIEYLRENTTFSLKAADSVPIAIRCFYDSTSYEDFIRKVISLDCDTDTICAIGGGIAEEYYGETLPNAEEIIKENLSEELYELYLR